MTSGSGSGSGSKRNRPEAANCGHGPKEDDNVGSRRFDPSSNISLTGGMEWPRRYPCVEDDAFLVWAQDTGGESAGTRWFVGGVRG
ncbi:hypothetical protein QJS10_CPB17g02013 [Acorus calamus]|uniref:Uncharacterized protein n=1 Tax=Acorus calamus TaxID=4465 RepID=A0AAV9CR80_ACOCL|nr:hypothetical protein QJS10_CPB17g02013 [Acorus calamus]